MNLVPLKVKIGLKGNRQHSFPPFNELDSVLRDGMDWSHFIDKFGGWHYDQLSGHVDDDPDVGSPKDTWLGMVLVPEDFADAAVARWPAQCEIIDENDAESLYNDRCHVRDPAVREDAEALQAIATKRTLGIPEDADDLAALDPEHPSSGRRTNKRKTWASFKQAEGITISPRVRSVGRTQ
jgi:hypothetical protein